MHTHTGRTTAFKTSLRYNRLAVSIPEALFNGVRACHCYGAAACGVDEKKVKMDDSVAVALSLVVGFLQVV